MKNLALTKIIAATCLFLYSLSSQAENMITEKERELLMFFSFKCASCHNGMLAMTYAKKNIDAYQRIIPFVTSDIDTHKSAALYFMMKLTQGKHQLSEAEMMEVGFQLYPKIKDEPMSPDVYLLLFKEYGMQIDMMDFLKAWEATHVMMGSAKDLTTQLREEKKTISLPMFRITHKGESRFWTPDFNEITLTEFKDVILSHQGE